MNKPTNHQFLKVVNERRVLHHIFHDGPISRVELADKTNLTQQTITNIVNRLLLDQTVVEGRPLSSNGGRKPIPLSVNKNHLYAVGVEIAVKYVKGTLMNFNKEVIKEYRENIDHFQHPEHSLESMITAIRQLLDDFDQTDGIKGIGLSVQGTVDASEGIVLYAPDLQWKKYALKHELEKAFPYPVYIENDVNIIALVENMDGALADSRNNITLKFDQGIGGAIVYDNKIYTGASHVAGEIGHFKVFRGREADPCHCGGRGCLTTTASIGRIVKQTGRTFEQVIALLNRQDPEIMERFHAIGDAIAEVICNIVTFLNPEHVLLSGRLITGAREVLLPHIHRRIAEDVPFDCRNVQIILQEREINGAMMAAGLVIQYLFSAP